ncbi:hypothetical protein PR048_015188 [Dryococelus australis]|uniref:Uncharacterized protein n=1 Tax=Dryococelus australis TaxID=614101 RepID=A0ABQ9HGI4_9NEOP|nr:hypothetical protein PR048_015188 [Dryococelus australis]
MVCPSLPAGWDCRLAAPRPACRFFGISPLDSPVVNHRQNMRQIAYSSSAHDSVEYAEEKAEIWTRFCIVAFDGTVTENVGRERRRILVDCLEAEKRLRWNKHNVRQPSGNPAKGREPGLQMLLERSAEEQAAWPRRAGVPISGRPVFARRRCRLERAYAPHALFQVASTRHSHLHSLIDNHELNSNIASHQADPGSIPAGSLRIFACGNRAGRYLWSACFLGDLLFAPALSFRHCSILISIALIGSQDLDSEVYAYYETLFSPCISSVDCGLDYFSSSGLLLDPGTIAAHWRGRGGVVVRLLTSHLDEPYSIPGGVVPGIPHMGIVSDNAAVRCVFSGISLLSRLTYEEEELRGLMTVLVLGSRRVVKRAGKKPSVALAKRRRYFSPCGADVRDSRS